MHKEECVQYNLTYVKLKIQQNITGDSWKQLYGIKLNMLNYVNNYSFQIVYDVLIYCINYIYIYLIYMSKLSTILLFNINCVNKIIKKGQ